MDTEKKRDTGFKSTRATRTTRLKQQGSRAEKNALNPSYGTVKPVPPPANVVEVENLEEKKASKSVQFTYQNEPYTRKNSNDSDGSANSNHSEENFLDERLIASNSGDSIGSNSDFLSLEIDDSFIKPPRVQSFYRWVNNGMTQLWPVVFTGILLHDLIEFSSNPQQRYETTLRDVLLGWPRHPNLPTVLNHMGTDLPGETTLFWGPTLAIATFSLVGAAVGRPLQDYIVKKVKAQLPNDLNPLNVLPPFLQNHPETKKNLKRGLQAVALLWSVFAYVRLLNLIIQKGISRTAYDKNKAVCEAKSKTYAVVSRLANYACAVCPEWNDILLKDIYTSQDCLSGLMLANRSAQNILDRISEIAQHKNLSNLDFSRQLIMNWSDEIFANILSILTVQGLDFDLNFAAPSYTLQQFPTAKLDSINKFLSQTNSSHSIDISNLQLNPVLGQNLISNLPLTTVSFTAVNSALGQAIREFETKLPGSAIQYLNLGSNGIIDTQFPSLFRGVVAAENVSTLLIDNNPLGDLTLITIGEKLNTTLLNRLGLSSLSGFSSQGLIAFGQGFTKSKVNALDMSNDGMDIIEVTTLCPYFKNSSLEDFNFSSNNLVSSYAVKQFFAGMPYALKHLTIMNVNLDDTGMGVLANFVNGSQLETLNISQNNFSIDSWGVFIVALMQSNVSNFVCRGNLLSAEYLIFFTDSLMSANQTALTHVDIGDNADLDDDSLTGFIKACAKAGIKNIVISKTGASDAVANEIAELLKAGYSFDTLDISDTNISHKGLMIIMNAARGSNLQVVNSANIKLLDEDLEQAAMLILKAHDNLSYLGNPSLNQDEIRNLASAVPTIPLKRWDVSTIGPIGRGFTAFRQAEQYTFFHESPIISVPNNFQTLSASNTFTASSLPASSDLARHLVEIAILIFILKVLLKPVMNFTRQRLFAVPDTAPAASAAESKKVNHSAAP